VVRLFCYNTIAPMELLAQSCKSCQLIAGEDACNGCKWRIILIMLINHAMR